MLEINITEFRDYDQKGLHEYLSLHEETLFRIMLPKSSLAYQEENFIIYWQYYLAAHAGQKLSDIASKFEYFVPSEFKPIDFLFLLECADMEKLAEVLFVIINGCFHANPIYNTFHDEGTIFYEAAMRRKIKCATWGLLMIADKYLE